MDLGYVLHVKKYRESSSLVYFFTKHHGRVSCVAKGARRQKSNWRGVLQPFSKLSLEWSGRGELYTLCKAETTAATTDLQGNRVYLGYYINELLIKSLANEDPHFDLFIMYESFLQDSMGLSDEELEINVRYFELCLLKELGYNVQLTHDMSGAKVKEEEFYSYLSQSGLVQTNDKVSGITGKDLLDFYNSKLSYSAALPVKRLTRAMLNDAIGGKELQTRKVYSEVLGFI